jgi:hypothetical protein
VGLNLVLLCPSSTSISHLIFCNAPVHKTCIFLCFSKALLYKSYQLLSPPLIGNILALRSCNLPSSICCFLFSTPSYSTPTPPLVRILIECIHRPANTHVHAYVHNITVLEKYQITLICLCNALNYYALKFNILRPITYNK